MLPFDRLVKAMDAWVEDKADVSIVAQIGSASYRPSNFDSVPMMTPGRYRECVLECDLVVSHVGMGTVLTASELGRPLVALARQPELSEVTSNHQLATARWLANVPGVKVIASEGELDAAIRNVSEAPPRASGENPDRVRIVETIRNFIHS